MINFVAFGFVMQETIGMGSYGKVKRAYSNELKKDVAVKIITLRKAKPEYVEKFLRERPTFCVVSIILTLSSSTLRFRRRIGFI